MSTRPPALPTVAEFARLVRGYGQACAERALGERLHHAEKNEAAVIDAYRQQVEARR